MGLRLWSGVAQAAHSPSRFLKKKKTLRLSLYRQQQQQNCHTYIYTTTFRVCSQLAAVLAAKPKMSELTCKCMLLTVYLISPTNKNGHCTSEQTLGRTGKFRFARGSFREGATFADALSVSKVCPWSFVFGPKQKSSNAPRGAALANIQTTAGMKHVAPLSPPLGTAGDAELEWEIMRMRRAGAAEQQVSLTCTQKAARQRTGCIHAR